MTAVDPKHGDKSMVGRWGGDGPLSDDSIPWVMRWRCFEAPSLGDEAARMGSDGRRDPGSDAIGVDDGGAYVHRKNHV